MRMWAQILWWIKIKYLAWQLRRLLKTQGRDAVERGLMNLGWSRETLEDRTVYSHRGGAQIIFSRNHEG